METSTMPPALSPEDYQKIVIGWNNTTTDYPHDKCVHQLFEEQVTKTPEAVALVFNDEQLTYDALNQRANQLAHHLRQLGVKPDTLVGIYIERSFEMIIGLLAILKAGGAYVPLDPNYPQERLLFMLDDAQLDIILTQSKLLSQLRNFQVTATHQLCIDHWQLFNEYSTENPSNQNKPTDLVYVIYTSGSTGKPKGVLIEHRGLCNLATAQTKIFGIQSDDVVLQFASFSFDASIWDIVMGILSGAKLCLLPQESLTEANSFIKKINQYAVTIVTLPSSFLMNLPLSEKISSLKTIIVAGEACPPRLVNDWAKKCFFFNAYGPTESTVCATIKLCNDETFIEKTPPIGKPIPNFQTYILDENLQPLNVGEAGELYIGGIGLARGYLNRPQMTAQRFIPNPFNDNPNSKLYKTGDLVRWLPNGDIEFIGRVDNQVKIRGFRIELGEIEAILAQHEAIKETIVNAYKPPKREDKNLVAYFTLANEQEIIQTLYQKIANDFVKDWQILYDEIYTDPTKQVIQFEEKTSNITGWNSTYTDMPIPEQEMRLWIKNTVSRILKLNPANVLEIGCGTGLLLSRIAPQTIEYYGTDYSKPVLNYTQTLIDPNNTTLLHKLAHDFSGIPKQFNVVILNSIIQYFPSLDYLFTVIQKAIQSIHHSGAIFIGDVRNYDLLEIYHTSVQYFRTHKAESVSQLKTHIQIALLNENELLISPQFFLNLTTHFPEITYVDIQLKQGDYSNELTKFRYDVTLYINENIELFEIQWRDWQIEQLNVSTLAQRLKENPQYIALKNIPNAHICQDVDLFKALQQTTPAQLSIAEWDQTLSFTEGVKPQDIWDLAQQFDYTAVITWSSTDLECYDIVLYKQHNTAYPNIDSRQKNNQSTWANNPLRAKLNQTLAPKLRAFLQQKLPDYMVPASFILMDNFPLTPNGKIDRQHLPIPDIALQIAADQYVAPQTTTEKQLVALWTELLNIERVGIQDNFFMLGGHSLLATRIISRAREIFKVDIGINSLFGAPTVKAFAQLIDNLSKTQQTFDYIPILSHDQAANLPLSLAQQQLWLHTQVTDNKPVYNEPFTIYLGANIQSELLEKSFNFIIQRHDALRATFTIASDGKPRQHIHSPILYNIPVHDLTSLSVAEAEQQALQLAKQALIEPFDLARYPLFRVMLVKISDADYRLYLAMHHLILDGYSLALFPQELAICYKAFLDEAAVPLSPPKVQYSDYTLWQDKHLTEQIFNEQLEYWQEKLAELPRLALPIDYPYPAFPSFKGEKYVFEFSTDLTTQIKQFAHQNQTTLYAVLLTALNILLYRYTQQSDIVVGTTMEARDRPELDGVMGLFLNTTVIRTQCYASDSVITVLQQVQQNLLEAREYQSIPFDRLVEQLRPERQSAGNPLLQVVLTLDPPAPEEKLFGWHWSYTDISNDTAKFDLTFEFNEYKPYLTILLEYNTDIFRFETVQRMAAHLEILLSAMVSQPQQTIDKLPILTSAEQQLMQKWNATAAPFPDKACIHHLFEQQVTRTPDNVAVIYAEQQLTYAELNHKANQLAHYLLKQGIQPETLIGIYIERSLEMIIAILAVFKAGAAYVPLDPAYPQERLQWMLTDAQIKIILTQASLQQTLATNAHKICLDKDWQTISFESSENPQLALTSRHLAYVIYTSGSTGKPKGVLVEHKGLCNLVYAQIDYFNIQTTDRLLQFSSINFDASAWEIIMALIPGAALVLVPIKTVLSKIELTDLIEKKEVSIITLTPTSLLNLLEVDKKLKYLRLIIVAGEQCPSELIKKWGQSRQFFNAYGPTETTVCASAIECIPNESVKKPSEKQRSFILTPSYQKPPPIGYPIHNTQLYILDSQQQPVPIGVAGELYIGGVGVARGYLNRPDLTAERFIPNPFVADPEARMYKTGDLVRYLPSGQVEFIGRIDHQVKIRGFRIELGEIEAVLKQNPTVEDAVVMVREDYPGDKQIVAYVVSNLVPERLPIVLDCPIELPDDYLTAKTADISYAGAKLEGVIAEVHKGDSIKIKLKLPSNADAFWLAAKVVWQQDEEIGIEFEPMSAEHYRILCQGIKQLFKTQGLFKVVQRTAASHLRAFLQDKLPQYMLPAAFVVLEALPLTPNGKVDRQALPPPDNVRTITEKFIPPRDTLELQLVQMWEHILSRHPIGIRDNFFELGGHSLLAVRLMANIKQHFGKTLGIAVLFQNPTIEHLAKLLRSDTTAEQWSPVVPIQTEGRLPPLFCVAGSGGNVMYFHALARALGNQQPFYGLQSRGLDGKTPPYTTVEDIAAAQVEAIQKQQPRGPYYLAGHSFGGMVAYAIAHQLYQQGETVAMLAILDIPVLDMTIQVDWDEVRWLTTIAKVIELLADKSLHILPEALQRLDAEQRLHYFRKRLIATDILPTEADIDQVRGLLQVIRANEQAHLSYIPPAGYPGHITLFRTSAVYEDVLGFLPEQALPTRLDWGWQKLTTQPVTVHNITGNHASMLIPPHVEVLAQQLKQAILETVT